MENSLFYTKKAFLVCYLCIAALGGVFGQGPSQAHRVFVIGNIADIPDENIQAYADALQQLLLKVNDPFTLIYSGDVSSQKNFDQNALTYDSIRISLLLKAGHFPNSRQLLIPGDRDWLNSGVEGWKYSQKLEKILEKSFKRVNWVPGRGCPGPKEIELDDHLLFIGLNTQFWNHPFEKPTPTEAECPISREGDFIEALEDAIDEAGNKNVIIAGHFPLISNGIYGGRNSLKRHIFPLTEKKKNLYVPLPIFGSLYAAYRQNIGDRTDIINRRFNPMRKTLLEIMEENRSMVYLSGHEKNIQILKSHDNFFINSGAAHTVSMARKDPKSLLISKVPGMIELIYHPDGRLNSQTYEYTNSAFLPTHPISLLNSPCLESGETENINLAYTPCKEEPIKSTFSFPFSGACTAQGGKEYQAGGFKKMILGHLYRETWTTTIMAPFLSIGETYGGLKVLERGGGVQTQSLKFAAGNKQEYVFRSTNKDPSNALPPELRTRFFNSLSRQATATQHPYGAIAVDHLLNHTDILHAHPVLYLMPDDERLGPYRAEFAGMLGMLEERPQKAKKQRPASFDADNVIRSYQLFAELYEDHDNRVDKEDFLESRIFDIWIGDRGRHEENFKWASFKQEKGNLYRPIPRDRDHAFSVLDGFVPWLIDRPWALPFFEDFDFDIKDIKSLNYSARHLDRLLLTELEKEDWIRIAKQIQETFTDERIEAAIKAMPMETYEISGREIVAKLKQRREDLLKHIENYYLVLATEVDVVGSNEREYFEVVRNANGSVTVRMFNMESFAEREKGSRLLFERLFLPEETEEIRLYGLGSKDIFDISGTAEESIKIRVLGGDGMEYISDKSYVKKGSKKTLIYEKDKKSIIEKGREGKQLSPYEDMLYDYRRKAFAYHGYLPIPILSYSSDEGFKAGWGYQFTRRSFGKEEYASKHTISTYFSTESNFGLKYTGKFRQAIREWDFQMGAEWARPDRYNNFFGSGNESTFSDSLFALNFYRSRNQTLNINAGFSRSFLRQSSFILDFRFEKNDRQSIDNNILNQDEFSDILGINDIDLVQAQAALNLDFRDNRILPERGMQLYLSHKNGIITSNGNSNFGMSEGFISWHGTTHSIKHPFTLGIKIGGGDSYGEIPFYNRFTLGQRENLHGFRRRRFNGNDMAYLNTEIRLKLGNGKAFVPISYGLTAFYDKGRVFLDGEDSDVWHKGYGFGFYLIPASRNLTFQLAVGFSEESSGLVLFTLGSLLR